MNPRSTTILAAVLAAAAVAPAAASAATRYASPQGAASGDCTSATAPCTLPHALAQATQPDVVIALRGAGTYTLAQQLTLPPGVTLRGEAGPRPVVVGPSTARAFSIDGGAAETAVALEHLEIRGGTGRSALRIGSHASASDLVIQADPTVDFPAAVWMSGNGVIRNSVVRNTGGGEAAIMVYLNSNTAPARVESVTAVAYNSRNGIQAHSFAYYEDGTPSTPCVKEKGWVVVRNSIARGGIADVSARTQAVEPSCPPSAQVDIAHSNYRSKSGDTYGAVVEGDGNQTSPEQTDDATIFGDATLFHQKPGAPTIDAGDSALATGTDIDGEPRVQQAAVDIGADEIPPPPTVATGAATDVTTTTARLNGTVVSGINPVSVVFDYGAYGGYSATTPVQVVQPGSGPVTVSAALEGLAPALQHNFRIRATDALGRTVTGADATFTTASPAGSAPLPSVAAAPLEALTVPRTIRRSTFLRRGLKVRFRLGVIGSRYDLRLRARMRIRGVGAAVTLGRARRSDAGGAQSVTLRPARRLRRLLARTRRLRMTQTLNVVAPGHPPLARTATVRMRR